MPVPLWRMIGYPQRNRRLISRVKSKRGRLKFSSNPSKPSQPLLTAVVERIEPAALRRWQGLNFNRLSSNSHLIHSLASCMTAQLPPSLWCFWSFENKWEEIKQLSPSHIFLIIIKPVESGKNILGVKNYNWFTNIVYLSKSGKLPHSYSWTWSRFD